MDSYPEPTYQIGLPVTAYGSGSWLQHAPMGIGAGLFLDAGGPVAEALEVLVMLGIVVHALAFPGLKPNKE